MTLQTREWLIYTCGIAVGLGCAWIPENAVLGLGLSMVGFFGSYLIPETT